MITKITEPAKQAIKKVMENSQFRSGLAKVGTAILTSVGSHPIVKVIGSTVEFFLGNSNNYANEPASSAIQQTISSTSEMMVQEGTSMFSEQVVNSMANAITLGMKYALMAPIHIISSVFYHTPLALWRGITLKPIKTSAIDNGTDVIIYIGQNANGEIIIKAGYALFALVKIAVIKGIITIIIIYIIYCICKFTVNKTINFIYFRTNKNGIEEYEAIKDNDY